LADIHKVLPQLLKAPTSSDSRQDAPGASLKTRELREGKRTLQRVLGRFEGRLELIEVAESTLPEESLERERERADTAELEARELYGPSWRGCSGPGGGITSVK
jgi:hypothetical protein